MENKDMFYGGDNVKELPVANIVVAGITGAGKSTLVNAVFGRDLAETGQGKAITEHMAEYYNAGSPICIWDTVGLEIDAAKTEKSIRDIKKKIEEKAMSHNEKDYIHAIWYCINSGSNRYQEGEIRFISELHKLKVPFIIVLTQCTDDPEVIDSFEAVIRNENKKRELEDIDIIQVLAEDKKTRLGTIEKFGLEELVNATTDKMPDYLSASFIAAQNVCRENKRTECEKIILNYVKQSMNGTWDNIWLINIPATNEKIKQLLIEISMMYKQIINEDELILEVAKFDLNFENIWNGLIVPWQGEYGKKVQDMFEKKVGGGYEGDFVELPKNYKAARLIAYYGCIFIDSVEETWDDYNNKKIENIKKYVDELIKNINNNLKKGAKNNKNLIIKKGEMYGEY